MFTILYPGMTIQQLTFQFFFDLKLCLRHSNSSLQNQESTLVKWRNRKIPTMRSNYKFLFCAAKLIITYKITKISIKYFWTSGFLISMYIRRLLFWIRLILDICITGCFNWPENSKSEQGYWIKLKLVFNFSLVFQKWT